MGASMSEKNSDRLADVIAALGEFGGRLGLAEGQEALLQSQLDAIRIHMLWRPDEQALASALRTIRQIVQSAPDSPLAEGALQELDALLDGAP